MAQLVEQLTRNEQVVSSSLIVGSIDRGVAQFGSAFGSGLKGRRFKSCHPDQQHDAALNVATYFCELRYFLCPKEYIHIVQGKSLPIHRIGSDFYLVGFEPQGAEPAA